MIFTNPIKYAIRAMTYLGGQEPGKLSSIREIAKAMDIPLPYLAKIINRLSRRRLVTAKRGPNGGVMLGKPASQITVNDIVDAMGASMANKKCILGLSDCSDIAPCPVHDKWKSVREVLIESLHEQTITDLVHSYNAKLAMASKS
jgi:Rrf2 family iron-sulfur cluster assembly transcriptional regulator